MFTLYSKIIDSDRKDFLILAFNFQLKIQFKMHLNRVGYLLPFKQ